MTATLDGRALSSALKNKFGPQGTSGCVWRHFRLSNLGGAWKVVLLTSSEQRPGRLCNILQCPGLLQQQRVVQLKMSRVPHFRNPAGLSWEILLLVMALTRSLGSIQLGTVLVQRVQKPSPMPGAFAEKAGRLAAAGPPWASPDGLRVIGLLAVLPESKQKLPVLFKRYPWTWHSVTSALVYWPKQSQASPDSRGGTTACTS